MTNSSCLAEHSRSNITVIYWGKKKSFCEEASAADDRTEITARRKGYFSLVWTKRHREGKIKSSERGRIAVEKEINEKGPVFGRDGEYNDKRGEDDESCISD